MKTKIIALSILILSLGCTKTTPDREYMPDMYESTSLKAQKEDPFSKDGAAARIPPEGTVPRGYTPYKYTAADTDKAGRELKNPLVRTKMNVERGQKIFNTYCIVCHGPKGNGEGFVVPPYPHPPSLLSDKVVRWPDGSIFNVISRGQNLMPSYATQIRAEDRWAVIHYVRALQRAPHPTKDDMKEFESEAAE
jgi:mono/diheme cytochrome c family protein